MAVAVGMGVLVEVNVAVGNAVGTAIRGVEQPTRDKVNRVTRQNLTTVFIVSWDLYPQRISR